MDTSKYKSVATKMDTYHKAKLMAENTHRSIGSYISMVVDEAWKKQKPALKGKLKDAA
jgi:hypothetical protein|tara:strand:- start:2556 stop:2729 length:174 start_codon:yes stop_codon:yes gene_type:complete